ncbi:UBP1-associated protein 2A-like isoform X3 [Nymphaea colorata]|uniref:UBP1-associated protein 2A-like isoform X3 n=1 Tax=Nymphaea colorata TaxID=210225 RepID=UPI00214E64F9|nr:UBP1-associated protein 2A-like isoform X3 [Nymphaea colorata]
MAKKRKAPPKVEPPPPEESSSSEEEEEEEEEEVEEVEEEEVEEEEEEEEEEAEEEEEEKEKKERAKEEEEGREEDESDGEEEEEQDAAASNSGKKNKRNKRKDLVRKLLEPFGKDQLVDILMQACAKNPKIVDRINSVADTDPSQRKIFIHGLGWDATTEQVLSVFKKFGPIEECKLVTDRATGRSKGYAFLIYKHRAGAQKALKQPQKKVGSRMTACQLASDGPVPSQPVFDASDRKVFVSNVPPEVNVDKLRILFQKFGELEEGPLGLDRVTGRPRGFAIFIYKTVDGARRALEEPYKLLEGHQLHCQKAVDGFKPGAAKAATTPQAVVPMVGAATALPPNDLALTHTGGSLLGLPNSLGQGVGQNMNPMLTGASAAGLGISPVMNTVNPTGISPRVNPALPTSVATGGSALGGLYGAQASVNNASPNIMSSYGSQAAFQGLGPYQGASQIGQSAATRTQPGVGSLGGFSSYLGR